MDTPPFDSPPFSPKVNIIENLKETNREIVQETPISLYIVIIATIAMISILYQKSNINNLYDKIPNPIHLVVHQIKSWVLSFFQPTIHKNSIKIIRYSYELPKSLDFLFH